MNIKIASTFEKAFVYGNQIIDMNPIMIGFDTETTIERLENKGLVSIISICLNEEHIYIFQIYKIWKEGKGIPSSIQKILLSERIIKVGVNLNYDMELLFKSYNLKSRGYIDIQYLTYTLNIPVKSMHDLCTIYLPDFPIKESDGHKGDWDGILDYKQIKYASEDAIRSLFLYIKIMKINEIDLSKKTNESNDEYALYSWIQNELNKSEKNLSSLMNQIVNSYGPWIKLHVEKERKQLAINFINKFIEDKLLLYDDKTNIISNISEDKLEIIPEEKISNFQNDIYNYFGSELNGLKYRSVINKIINSYPKWSSLSYKQREYLAKIIIDNLISENKIQLKK